MSLPAPWRAPAHGSRSEPPRPSPAGARVRTLFLFLSSLPFLHPADSLLLRLQPSLLLSLSPLLHIPTPLSFHVVIYLRMIFLQPIDPPSALPPSFQPTLPPSYPPTAYPRSLSPPSPPIWLARSRPHSLAVPPSLRPHLDRQAPVQRSTLEPSPLHPGIHRPLHPDTILKYPRLSTRIGSAWDSTWDENATRVPPSPPGYALSLVSWISSV
jgi:hypothetical protein